MKLLVFLAKGFETIEFSAFIDVMGWAKTDFDCKIDVVTCKCSVLYQKPGSLPVYRHKELSGLSMFFYSESKLVSINSFNWALFIVPNFIVGLPFNGQSNRLGMVRILNALSSSGS